MKKHNMYIGTSGWSYKHWINTFYPQGVKAKDRFAYYQSQFDTVEINNTFYKLPKAETFLKWQAEAPPGFFYIVKASRFITHMKKLHDPVQSSALFFERVIHLKEKLGAILFQLPPVMKYNEPLLEIFLEQLPKGFRFVFEFRNADWYRPSTYALLKQHNCAFCIYELDQHLSPMEITADFVYLRLHGPGKKYQGSYPDETLRQWATQCRKWLKSKDVYVYFDNDEKGFAAFNALRLKEFVGQN